MSRAAMDVMRLPGSSFREIRITNWKLLKWRHDAIYQLEGSHDQRICVRPSKGEKKAFRYYNYKDIRKKR